MNNSPCLHYMHASFMTITGQGMSAWMMQSMSNSVSTEMQQQYAGKIMKQQMLKIHQQNATMESAIVHMKRKTTSEPPVEEVSIALSSMTDAETTSGMMEQWQDSGNINDDDEG